VSLVAVNKKKKVGKRGKKEGSCQMFNRLDEASQREEIGNCLSRGKKDQEPISPKRTEGDERNKGGKNSGHPGASPRERRGLNLVKR